MNSNIAKRRARTRPARGSTDARRPPDQDRSPIGYFVVGLYVAVAVLLAYGLLAGYNRIYGDLPAVATCECGQLTVDIGSSSADVAYLRLDMLRGEKNIALLSVETSPGAEKLTWSLETPQDVSVSLNDARFDEADYRDFEVTLTDKNTELKTVTYEVRYRKIGRPWTLTNGVVGFSGVAFPGDPTVEMEPREVPAIRLQFPTPIIRENSGSLSFASPVVVVNTAKGEGEPAEKPIQIRASVYDRFTDVHLNSTVPQSSGALPLSWKDLDGRFSGIAYGSKPIGTMGYFLQYLITGLGLLPLLATPRFRRSKYHSRVVGVLTSAKAWLMTP